MRFLLAFAAIAALAIGSWSVAARAVERAEPCGSLVSVTKSSFDPRRHALTEFADLEPE